MLVILAVGGIVTWPYWSPTVAPLVQDYLPARPADEQITSLEDRIADLEQTVRQAAPRQEDVTALQQDTQALREQMDTLIGRLQDVEPGGTAVVPEWIDQRLSAFRSEAEQRAQRIIGLDEQVNALDEQVSQLGEQVSQLGEQVGGLGEQVPRLDEQSGGLGEQVSGLDEQVGGLGAQVASLEEQVRSLAQQVEARGDATQNTAAVALGLSRLSETIGTSRAFQEELEAIKNSAGEAVLDEEILQPLEAHAANGVSTFADLYRRFPVMAEAVARAGVEVGEEGFLETTFNRLRSLVTIRRTGAAALEAGGADAALEMARNRLDAGDLPGAINAVEQLEGKPAEAARWWLDAARSRLAVQRAMERMQIRALSTLLSKEG